ncbi:hypothetical protein [Halomontanus rarus]|uniref:hypothetical protein n=1 Tax=Halomontanus rarus TaxID=3034020 RepID=UPI003CE4CD51
MALGTNCSRKAEPKDAQSALRHKSIETTHSAYSDIQAGETAGRIDEMVNNE